MYPWPVAHTLLNGKRFKIYEGDLVEGQGQAGHIIEKTKKSLVVATGQGAISLKSVQLEGKPRMAIADFLNGVGRNREVDATFGNGGKKLLGDRHSEVLKVFQEGAYSNIALNAHLSSPCLTDKDKALVTEIVYGTVARKITLEWILAHVIEDRDKLEAWVYDLLLLSLYQLAYLDKIPSPCGG